MHVTKFIPKGVTRAVGRASLHASKASPKYMFLAGLFGVGAGTVLACKATLKVEDILVDHEKMMLDIKTVQHETYSEQDRKHDKLVLYTQTAVKITKLYGPSIIIFGASIAFLTKSHNVMAQRQAALSAAYAGLDATFGEYRKRVQNELGEEKENAIYRDAQTSIKKVNGEKVKVVTGGGGGLYTELYSADTNHNFHVGSHEDNIMTLRQRENYLNDRLRMRGHLYLNEVLEQLGFEHSEEGSVVGWLYQPDRRDEHSGYSHVSFGCWTDNNRDQIDPLMMNNSDGIFLDFNVVGEIWRRLDEVKPIWKLTDKAHRRQNRG